MTGGRASRDADVGAVRRAARADRQEQVGRSTRQTSTGERLNNAVILRAPGRGLAIEAVHIRSGNNATLRHLVRGTSSHADGQSLRTTTRDSTPVHVRHLDVARTVLRDPTPNSLALPLLSQLASAQEELRSARGWYEKDWPRLRSEGHRHTHDLLRSIRRGVIAVQHWLRGETKALVTAFMSEEAQTFFDPVPSELIGLLPPPAGPVAGYVTDVGIGGYRAHENDQLVESSVGVGRFAQLAGVEGTDAIFELLNAKGSLFHQLGHYDGAASRMFSVGDYGELQSDLVHYEQLLTSGRPVATASVFRKLLQVKRFKDDFTELHSRFWFAVRDLQRSVLQSHDDINKALRTVKLLFISSLSNTVVYRADAWVERGHLCFDSLTLHKIGSASGAQIGSDTKAFLSDYTPRRLSLATVPEHQVTRVELRLNIRRRTSSGTLMVWDAPFIWTHGTFAYRGGREHDKMLATVKWPYYVAVRELGKQLGDTPFGAMRPGTVITVP